MRVEREIDDVFERHDRTAGDLGDHLRGVVDDRAFFRFVVEFAVDLRFGTEFFDDFDPRLHDGVGRVGKEHLILVDILGTDAERHVLIGVEVFVEILDPRDNRLGQQDLVSADKADIYFIPFGDEAGILEEVHLRRADEARDEEVDGIVVKVLRGIHLLHEAVLHDDDTGTHRHRFDLVVGDVDEGGGEAGVQLGDFRSHRSAELRVQVGQRFVEKEHFGFADDGTAERDTLSLTAGQSLGLSGQIVGDAENFRRRLDLLVDDFLRHLSQFETERHVVVHGHMGIQSVVLENHRDVPVLGNDVVDEFAVDVQFARRNFFKAGDHTQRRGFPAARRTDEHDEFLVPDVEGEVENSLHARGIHFVDAFQQKS